MMVLGRRDQPEVVFHQHKREAGGYDRPHWNHPGVVVYGNGFRLTHSKSLIEEGKSSAPTGQNSLTLI
jgi:hypothetical protein